MIRSVFHVAIALLTICTFKTKTFNARRLCRKSIQTYLMEHEALSMEENTYPLRLPMNDRVGDLQNVSKDTFSQTSSAYFDFLHDARTAPVGMLSSDGEVVEITGAFVLLDNLSQPLD